MWKPNDDTLVFKPQSFLRGMGAGVWSEVSRSGALKTTQTYGCHIQPAFGSTADQGSKCLPWALSKILPFLMHQSVFPHIPSISFSLPLSLSKHAMSFWTFPPHAGFLPSLLWASDLLTATSTSWFLVLLSSVWLLWMMQARGNNSTAAAGAPRAKDISCKYLHFLQGCVVWGQRIYSIYIYITMWVFAHGVIQNFPKCQQDKVAISYFWTEKFCMGHFYEFALPDIKLNVILYVNSQGLDEGEPSPLFMLSFSTLVNTSLM